MFCKKELFLLSIILYSQNFLKAEDITSSPLPINEVLRGNCTCGGFPTSTPEINSEPLLSQSSGLVVNCDEEGATTCKNLCLALATAAKAKGPEILCARLKDAKELKLSAFYKVCTKPWSYADMTADASLCCEDSKVKVCPVADNSEIPVQATAV